MKPQKKPKPTVLPFVASGTLRAFITLFSDWQRVRGYAEMTLHRNGYNLLHFVSFCEARGILRPQEVTRAVIDRYQKHLFESRTKKSETMSVRAQVRLLVTVRSFFKWLSRERHILYNPSSEMELPRIPRTLPRTILSQKEMEEILLQPDTTNPFGIRDRALLEILYSTGIRRKEASRLNVHEVDLNGHTLFVREGKGKKDRVVPLGQRAAFWLRKYLEEVRASLITGVDPGSLFLSMMGEPLHSDYLGVTVRRYVDKANLGKRGSCHLIRHTCATLMLEGGADVRFVQALLGHSNMSSTEIYTHVSIVKLKEVHARCHPAENKTGATAG